MRIALVDDAWHTPESGFGRALADLVAAVSCLGHDVCILRPSDAPYWRWLLGTRRPFALPAITPIRRWMQDARADAIHLMTDGPLGWLVRSYCVRHGLPFTSDVQANWPWSWLERPGWPNRGAVLLRQAFHRRAAAVLLAEPAPAAMLPERAPLAQGLRTLGVDCRLFRFAPMPEFSAPLGPLPRPVSLYVGPLRADSQLEAFLTLDLPGSKVVCGNGEGARLWRARHPDVHWLRGLPRMDRARLYASADVFVAPSSGAQNAIAWLEAMASGLPVAAIDGPMARYLIGDGQGGALAADLRSAWRQALKQPRAAARAAALKHDWPQVAKRFVDGLVPIGHQSTGGRY